MVDGKRPPTVVWIIPLLIGFVGFYRVTQSPIFEIYRAVDIVQLSRLRCVLRRGHGGDSLHASRGATVMFENGMVRRRSQDLGR